MKEKNLTISEFKAKALQELDALHRKGHTLLITKRGTPIARVIPIEDKKATSLEPGGLRDLLIREDDVVSPFGAKLWRAAEPIGSQDRDGEEA